MATMGTMLISYGLVLDILNQLNCLIINYLGCTALAILLSSIHLKVKANF